MKFYQRLAYYLVGMVMGLFVVALVWSGKDTRCNYFPNSRVLSNLRSKPFHYSIEANRRLKEDWIDTIDIKNILTKGDVDFDKSNVKIEGGKLYIIDGLNTMGEPIQLRVINYESKAVLENIIRK